MYVMFEAQYTVGREIVLKFNMAASHFTIRKALVTDCPGIMSMIKALAEHLQMLDRVQTTEEDLKRDGFSEDKLPVFQCVVVEERQGESRQLVGYAIYQKRFSSWQGICMYLEDIFVQPEYRGKGIGTALWKTVAKIALQQNCSRMDFDVLGWNEKAMSFYKQFGAVDITSSDEYHMFRLKQKELQAFAAKPNEVHIKICL